MLVASNLGTLVLLSQGRGCSWTCGWRSPAQEAGQANFAGALVKYVAFFTACTAMDLAISGWQSSSQRRLMDHERQLADDRPPLRGHTGG